MSQLITFGETMASFSPAQSGALRYVREYQLHIAGAESNVAIGLQKLGCDAGWMSRLGADEFGAHVRNMIRAEGVDTSGVRIDDAHRTGVMFKQTGARETSVFYYRDQSAASFMTPEDLTPDWFEGAKILHLTGVTPVLSSSCAHTVERAFDLAEERGIQVSFDPNIRRKLWGEVDYTPLLRALTLRASIVLIGRDEAEILFGVRETDAILDLLLKEGKAVAVALKDGADGAWVATSTERLAIPPFPCTVVDPVGAGDGFDAGFLAGFLRKETLAVCGQMGAIVGALATETAGDIEGYPSWERMLGLLAGTAEVYR